MIPRMAQPIAQARLQRLKPAEMVIVSLVGEDHSINPQVLISDPTKFDWWWCKGLEVMVHARKGTAWRLTLEAIARTDTKYLGLWDVDRKQGADVSFLPDADTIMLDRGRWKWGLSFITWTDFQNKEYERGHITG